MPAYNGQRGESFNDGWRFHKGDATGAERPDHDDAAWRSLSVPHDWSIEQEFNQDSPARSLGGVLDAQFAVTGPGRIAGTDNGNPIDVTSSLASPRRNAFSGKALAIVRSTGSAGAIQVTASSAGLTSGVMTVTAR